MDFNNHLPVRVLFVCAGNVCRSPAAEAIMNFKLKEQGLVGKIVCDSAGTVVFTAGAEADFRMRELCRKRGFEINVLSRKFDDVADFIAFDYIFVMDDHVYHDIRTLDEKGEYDKKIFHITDFCAVKGTEKNIHDPFTEGYSEFNHVLDELDYAIEGILKKILREKKI